MGDRVVSNTDDVSKSSVIGSYDEDLLDELEGRNFDNLAARTCALPRLGFVDVSLSVNGSSSVQDSSTCQPGLISGTVIHASDPAITLTSLKRWTTSALKSTKQLVSEKLGRRQRTVDCELEPLISSLHQTHQQYRHLYDLALSMLESMATSMESEQLVADWLVEQSVRSSSLNTELGCCGKMLSSNVQHSSSVLVALQSLVSALNTLITKVIEDAMTSVKAYERERVIYDACRSDWEDVLACTNPKIDPERVKTAFEEERVKYDDLRRNLVIKLRYLDGNKVGTMQRYLHALRLTYLNYHAACWKELSSMPFGSSCDLSFPSAVMGAPPMDAVLAPAVPAPQVDTGDPHQVETSPKENQPRPSLTTDVNGSMGGVQ